MRRAASLTPVKAGMVAVLCLLIVALARGPAAGRLPQTHPDTKAYEGPRCFTTVVPEVTRTLAQIVASRETGQQIFSQGQTVYLRIEPGQRVAAGARYRLYRIEGEIEHPLTGDIVGRAINLLGTVEVLDADGVRAVARITDACGEVEVGDRLHPLLTRDVTAGKQRAKFDGDRLVQPRDSDATVIYGTSESLYDAGSDTARRGMTVRQSYAVGDVITIDQGSADGWSPGQSVLLYGAAGFKADGGLPRLEESLLVAQGMVFWLQRRTAAVLITDSDRVVLLGYRARPQ